jgi:hypothetical protein
MKIPQEKSAQVAGDSGREMPTIVNTFRFIGTRAEVTVDDRSDNLDEVLAYVVHMVTLCCEAGVDKLLLDHRKFDFNVSTAATYELAVRCAERLPHVGVLRIALVVRPERMDNARVYEALGVGQGVSVKVFERLRMARIWLDS